VRERRVLLFDLGGVLIDNATFDELPSLLPDPPPREVLQDRWLSSEAVRSFERGEIGAETFAGRFIAEWGMRLSRSDFIERFARWPKGPYEGALELLAGLRRRHLVACLTNCNELHWARLTPVLAQMDRAFSSHLCGLVKPDEAAFRHVVSALGCDPGEIVFFDDSARNVEAARGVGMAAYRVAGFGPLHERVKALDLADSVDSSR
jgi:putative hydrolase of the HAD superfamily